MCLLRSRKPARAREEYNSKGRVTKSIDPVGRETDYFYGTNNVIDPNQATGTGIDLLQVKQKNGAGYDLLQAFTYDAQHRVLTRTDGAGQTTAYTYNAQGQRLTVTTPARASVTENRTTMFSYDTNGYLQSVTGPIAGDVMSWTYDAYGRPRTSTDADSYTVTYDYDALDRQTKATYPDGTYQETIYNRLDAERLRDRLGRWAHFFHDALRRTVAVRDAAGHTTTQQWCTCGSLDKLIDGDNNATTWERDLQGRVTREVRPDSSAWEYTYENTTSRLKQRKDPKNQIAAFDYFLDDKFKQTTYTAAVIATPSVSLTYDASQGRLETVTDGTGTRTYSYYPITAPPALGAGLMASIDGPLTNDTATFAYDELGRLVSRTLNGVTTTWAYDSVGRMTTLADPVGSFNYTYVGTGKRVNTLTYPNGQTSTFTYFPNNQDKLIQDIHHRTSAGATISRFSYAFDVAGNIRTWTQQNGASPANAYDFDYDPLNEVTSAIYRTTDTTPSILKRYGYRYDAAGNRTAEQIDDAVTGFTYDSLNRLTSQQPGGPLLVKGTTNEAATVLVQGQPGATTAGNAFSGVVQVPSGTSTVQVQATDPSGNTRTNTYQIGQTGSSKSFTYDGNGNQTGDGVNTFEWDAENRLVTVKQGATTIAAFTYDGSGRRVTKTAGGVTTTYVYDRGNVAEERVSGGSTTRYVQNNSFDRPLAQVVGSVVSFFVADHLGTITAKTDSAGGVVLHRAYDPWGRILAGNESGPAFTGRDWDSSIGAYYYRARYYSAETGRFLSEDPIGLAGGLNRYAYVGNNPIDVKDPTGTQATNSTEVWWCIKHPEICAMASPCFFAAQKMERILNFGGVSDNDRNNALKHCFWACCMAQTIGSGAAMDITDNHEARERSRNPCPSQMDRHNNMQGITLGSANPNMNCFDLCNKTAALQCSPKNDPDKCRFGE